MYRPRHFDEQDPDALRDMLGRAPLGHLVVHTAAGFDASPLPFIARPPEADGEVLRLHGHVARRNPIWRVAPCDAFVVLPGPDAYISPSWYPSKAEHGKVVPTWNYEVVHVHGRLVAHDDVEWLDVLVRSLTAVHEARMAEAWSVDDAPADYRAAMLEAIVGIEVIATRLEAKRKLSQNKSVDERRGIVTALAGDDLPGAVETAALMSALLD